jgi:hypothetical protein
MVRKCDGALKKIGAPSFTPLARGGTQHFLAIPRPVASRLQHATTASPFSNVPERTSPPFGFDP